MYPVGLGDWDVMVESSDGGLFKVHRRNLKASCERFKFEGETTSAIAHIKVTESTETLNLLFQYMYPQIRPDLRRLEYKQLEDLAVGAEMYGVFGAIEMCSIQLGYVGKNVYVEC